MGVLSKVDLEEQSGRSFVVHPNFAPSFTPLGYDLRIGLHLALRSSAGGRSAEVVHQSSHSSVADEYVFPPNSANIIVTRERVWLSQHLMGTIHARGSLALRGLFMTSTTVDPNWDGPMIMRVFNSSHREERLKRDEAFCTMVLHQLSRSTVAKPETQPSRVIERLTELYGPQVAEAVNAYLNSASAHVEKNAGDDAVFQAKAFSRRGALVRKASILSSKGISLFVGWAEIAKFIKVALASIIAPLIVDWGLKRYGGINVIDPGQWWQGYLSFVVGLFGAIYTVPRLFRGREGVKSGPLKSGELLSK